MNTHSSTRPTLPAHVAAMEPAEAIRDTVEALERSGAWDVPEITLPIAVRTLADLCRLTEERAWVMWHRYAHTPQH
jgi:hypothetical protein